MEVMGNIELIKKSIEKKYDKDVRQIEKETEKEISQLKTEAKKKIDLQKAKIKTLAESEAKKIYSKTLSEEKLKAKKEFEEVREEFIKQIFLDVLKKAKEIAHSQKYIDFVKAKMPEEEGISIIADSDFYKKHFENVKVEKNIIGVKFQAKKITYDLSLDGILASKRDILRHIVSKVLFEI